MFPDCTFNISAVCWLLPVFLVGIIGLKITWCINFVVCGIGLNILICAIFFGFAPFAKVRQKTIKESTIFVVIFKEI
jgi:hypothetical protein